MEFIEWGGVKALQVHLDTLKLKFHPRAYASSLSSSENYLITELKTLMVVWAISHFQYHLYGHRVTVYTDYAAVKAVLDNISTSTSSTRQKQPKELSKKDKETTDEYYLIQHPSEVTIRNG